jgi:predicted secreted protein
VNARHRLSAIAAVGAAVCALGGGSCGGNGPEPAEGPETGLATGGTFTRDDREISVHSGERFIVSLASNPSVGDDWRVVGGLQPGLLELVSEDYESDTPDAMPGSGGTERLLFEAAGPGTATLTIFNCYRCGGDDRPLPENEAYAETLTFTVRVSRP